MSSQPLVRTTYEDQTNTPRGGNTGRGESRVDMEQYSQLLEQIHGSGLHSWGIASGLAVSAVTSPAAGLQISPGIGLDANGKHISLAAGGKAEINPSPAGTVASLATMTASGVTLPTPANSGGPNSGSDQYLTIEWRETFDDATWISSGGQTFQKLHTPWLRLQPLSSFPTPSSVMGQQLILGRVTLDASGTVTNLTPEYRRMTGLPVGSIQVQRATATPAPNLALDSGQAGSIHALASGGLDLTVPNSSDEIHLERDDGSNCAKVSLGAEKIVARQGTGTESVVIDSEAGSLTASGGITASSATVSGPISANSMTANANIDATTHIRQNRLYLSGGVGGSSFTYNAHRNDANTDWVFPDPTHASVTLEMDDADDIPRFQVWSNTTGTSTGWEPRFAIDGNTGNTWIGGDLAFSGNLFGKYGDASQAYWAWLWAQNSIQAIDISLPNPQPLFAFIALTSINHFQVQSPGTGNFAYITGVDGGNPFGRPIGDPTNSVWSGTAQTISFRLQSTVDSQAWAVAVVFPQQV